MAIAPTVEAVMQAGGAHIPPLLAAAEERLAALAAGHGHVLARHAGDTIAAGGKRLRPLLVLVVAGQSARAVEAVRAAVAVELIHSATLVHDDVLDAAALRRGRPTVVATAGRDIATATGDLLARVRRAGRQWAPRGGARAVRRVLRARRG
jgi:geranylgeranyl pyrophosphate synthase